MLKAGTAEQEEFAVSREQLCNHISRTPRLRGIANRYENINKENDGRGFLCLVCAWAV
jgi:hypothetical protein